MNYMIRVLLVDDHAVVRAGICQFLEQDRQIEVVAEAEDEHAARELIAALQPDVAILDIRLARGSGIDVARWARSEYPDLGILFLTAYDDDPLAMAALRAGANGYVLKTASPAEMVRAVREVYAGRSAFDKRIADKLLKLTALRGADTGRESLSERELQVLALAGKGLTNKEIGAELGISARTVQGHLARTFAKLHVNTRTEAVTRAVTLGLVRLEAEN